MIPAVSIKRIYETPSEKDGYRVLVDRLWPRGMTKEAAAVDEWAKDLAPTADLRKWYGHDPERWNAFRERYKAALKHTPAVADFCRQNRDKKHITLLYATKAASLTHAIVLKEVIDRLFGSSHS